MSSATPVTDSHAGAAARWRPLKALLGGGIAVNPELEVSDLTLDSRAVRPGGAFLACRGRTQHGLSFARQAASAGARAILWEPAPGVEAPVLGESVVLVAVPGLSAQAGFIADRFFDAPSASLKVIGITGTNGKTTCAWLLAQALDQLGISAAYFGTLGMGRASALRAAKLTTPDAVSVQRELAQERDAGARAVAMEVSSHALDQQRCGGVRFQVAAFTNLSRDHLDYHSTMERYGAVKAQLFDWPTLLGRVINVDDVFGAGLATRLRSSAGVLLTARHNPSVAEMGARFLRARSATTGATTGATSGTAGLQLEFDGSFGSSRLHSRLIGEFNIDNLLTVLGVLLALEIPLARACAALAECSAPPGRMEPQGGEHLPLVVVDYAHTPDALAKALNAARAHVRGKLWCVFGCGGDRDAGKRPLMGEVATRLADRVIVTDDNPRSEDPAAIAAAIVSGAGRHDALEIIHDRATAIAQAVRSAAAGDVVLVAGKGHEALQIVGTTRRPFLDRAVVAAALEHHVGVRSTVR
jgi:UDP-N-acetylmuramoyl-L-alanyl-D-glutamate--2,6-diaminopimelate ligase